MESNDKTWSTGGWTGKTPQYSYPENPRDSVKRQKDRTLEDEPLLRSEGVQYASGEVRTQSLSRSNSLGPPQTSADAEAVTPILWPHDGKN